MLPVKRSPNFAPILLRLNQALILLKNSDYGIATIAAKVGYHNSGHFAKLFKKAYGLGPREYRNLHGIK